MKTNAISLCVTIFGGVLAAVGARPVDAQVIFACMQPGSGVIYIVETKGACRAPKHVPLEWNVAGPAGETGAQGEQGPRGAPGPVPFLGQVCPTGESVIGFSATGSILCSGGGGGEVPVEICNGLDDNQDGGVDENLPFCFGGIPAPNTDGSGCLPGWMDVNGVASDGCESAFPDQWEPNNSFSEAASLREISPQGSSREVTGNFHNSGDQSDWYRLRVIENEPQGCVPGAAQLFDLAFTLTNVPPGSNYGLNVHDEAGAVLGQATSGPGGEILMSVHVESTCGVDDIFLIRFEVSDLTGGPADNLYQVSLQLTQLI